MLNRMLTALALTACFAAAATAEEGCHREELKAKLDTNHDGKLDKSERAAGKELFAAKKAEHEAAFKQNHPEEFAKADANGDGHIDAQEKKNFIESRMKEKHPEAFAKRDTNGNGDIDQGERKAFREQRQENFKTKHPEAFKQADKNGDGKLGACERHHLVKHRRMEDKGGKK
jgi:Ca2+-binding EF-hand superfamily protein